MQSTESTLRTELVSLNEQLQTKQVEVTRDEAKIDELSTQLVDLVNKLDQASFDKQELTFRLEEQTGKLASLTVTNADLFKSFKEMSQEKETLLAENGKMRTNHAKFENDAAKYINEKKEQAKKLHDEAQRLKVELKELTQLKQLECDALVNKYQASEFLLNQQIKELTEKCLLRLVLSFF
jgi:chromosome segregation ATPase